jgi:NAD(P)-dependent dehydrogenase (short-subunit alcohol dehydrogenase family)
MKIFLKPTDWKNRNIITQNLLIISKNFEKTLNLFQGKVAVITGAGSGIGRSLALQLNQAGAHLALCDIDHFGIAETLNLLENKSLAASIHPVDVSNKRQMRQFAADVIDEHRRVDILINYAGITNSPTPFTEITDQQFEKIIAVNMWGVYYGIRAFLPHLKTRPEASIITISSLAGLVGLAGYSPYAMSKFGVRALSESLAMELMGSDVHVMVVYPSGVKTNIIKSAPNLADEDREQTHQAFTRTALLTPDKAADKILRATQKKRHRLILGADARLVYLIRWLFPESYLKSLSAVFSRLGFG